MSKDTELLLSFTAQYAQFLEVRSARTPQFIKNRPWRVWSLADLSKKPKRQRHQRNRYRRCIRAIGKRIFAHGGLCAMEHAFEEVLRHHARIANVVDHAWEGIGGVWWA